MSANWTFLPVEIKIKILKHTDFETRCRLRQCSVLDRKVVDSLVICFPFIRIETDQKMVTVMICESRKQVMKVVLKKKKSIWLSSVAVRIYPAAQISKYEPPKITRYFPIYGVPSDAFPEKRITRNDNIRGDSCRKFTSDEDIEVILESLLVTISQKNMSIDTLNLVYRFPYHSIADYLFAYYRPVIGPRRKTKIVMSGMECLNFKLQFLPIDEIRIIYDESQFMLGDYSIVGRKYCVQSKHRCASIGKTMLWFKRIVSEERLLDLLQQVLYDYQNDFLVWYVPFYFLRESDCQLVIEKLNATVTIHDDITVIHFKNIQHSRAEFIAKIGPCGLVIEKVHASTVIQIDKNECLLDWACGRCDNSVANYYFRTIAGIEFSDFCYPWS